MPETVRRGFVPEDWREFGKEAQKALRAAERDIFYLVNRGYGTNQSVAFVGNRFQFSARQRTALTRATCTEKELAVRRAKELSGSLFGRTLFVDGFNLIITLEAALSGSTVLLCMDGTLRDLCGLRGTYRLIDKTDEALRLISLTLRELRVEEAVFVLDAPVSNSGRLKQKILKTLSGDFSVDVRLTECADSLLAKSGCVATSDSIILNRCGDWVNLAGLILKEQLPDFETVDLSLSD